jgi:hypothetical protein
MDSASSTGRVSDEAVDFLTFYSNDLDKRVIYFGFSVSCGHVDSIVAICEFNELDDIQ